MRISRLFTLIVFWTTLFSCQSSPAKKHKRSVRLDEKQALELLSRFTRDAVPTNTTGTAKNATVISKPTWTNSIGSLFGNDKKAPTDPPLKTHNVVVENKGPPRAEINQPNKNNDDESIDDEFREQGPKFDDKAIQRAFMVFGGLCALLLVYFGLKFMFIKKRKAVRRYGRVESSEMDLLESNEDEEEDDDTLFDIHSQRRT